MVFKKELRIKCFLFVLSLIGVLVILVSTSRYGVGISSDSIAYISIAKNILSGKGYLIYGGRPYLFGPPLFPTLLASFSLGIFEPFFIARYINAISFGLIILFSGFWLRKNIKSISLVILGSVAILLSIPLIKVSAFAWTEPVFILFSLLFLFEMSNFLKNSKFRSLFLSAIFVSSACSTRYIGVTLALTGLALLLFERNKSFSIKLKNTIVFGFISILPITIWLIRNYLISSTIVGWRIPSSFTFGQNLYSTFDTISVWFLPSRIPHFLRILIISFLFISLVVIFIIIIWKSKKRQEGVNLSHYMFLILFLIIYMSWLIVSASCFTFDSISDRLMSPVFVPLMLLIVFTIDNILKFSYRYLSKKALRIVLFVLFSLWLIYPLKHNIKTVKYSIKNGAGEFSTTSWKKSELIHYLKKHPLNGQIYSNAPDAICFFSGISSKLSPRRYIYNSPNSSSADLSQFRKSLIAGRNTYIVWFKNKHRPYLYSVKKLRSFFAIENLVSTSDGAIYIVTPNKRK